MQVAPFFTKGISTFTYGNDLPKEKERGFSALFDALTLLEVNQNTTAHGLKVACNSYKLARNLVGVLQKYLTDLKVIIIVRNDLVAQYGSAISGKKSGVMHSWYKGFENRRIARIRINKWYFIAYVLSILRLYETLRQLKQTHDVLELCYEGLLTDPKRFYDSLFSFLGLSKMTPTWLDSKKVMPPPIEYIENYRAMQRLQDDLNRGTVPEYVLLISRIIAHLRWRLSLVRRKIVKI